MMKIAIVGAEEAKWTKEQKEKAQNIIRCIFVRCSMPKDLTAEELELQLDRPWFSLVKGDLILVSGHCPKGGVDIWAEEIANRLGIQKEIYPAQVKRWHDRTICPWCEGAIRGGREGRLTTCRHCGRVVFPKRLKGYRSRNIQIAKACDVLYDIEPEGKRSGGTWTLEYAKKLGKEVHKIEIEP